VFALVSALLTGCGAGLDPPAGPSRTVTGAGGPTAAPVPASAGSRVVVTVPGLGSSTGGDGATGAPADQAASAPGATGTVTVTATVDAPGSDGPASEAPAGMSSRGAPSVTTGAMATARSGSATSSGTTAPPGSTTAAAPAGTDGGAEGPVTVDLSRCTGCTVIATHAAVAGALSAALATTDRGAVLLSVRPDGAVAGVINVPYGASFPAPPEKSLPCDGSGRCIVVAKQADGDAILSAFELTSDGAWRDVSGNDAFPSGTDRGVAADINDDGLLDIAVQESGGGQVAWMVLAWSGDRFSVLGCAPASDVVPSAGELSKDACLS